MIKNHHSKANDQDINMQKSFFLIYFKIWVYDVFLVNDQALNPPVSGKGNIADWR